ncbi:MAG: hypothetical protein NWF04_10620 [Candidatus Bathyarchaeota archaeon]|nr:hypothetical protein [Candidatus Bathyarchaeota archaeon]
MQTKTKDGAAMKDIAVFASRFGAKIALNPEFMVQKAGRYYLLNPRLKELCQGSFYYAGLYLGKTKNGVFFPSFNLLNLLLDVAQNRVVVDKRAAWLFICGKDVFQNGIKKACGSQKKGELTLVLNQHGECLGFGKVAAKAGEVHGKVVVRNILDLGDFLRRER